MNNEKIAKVLHISDTNEEHVTLLINEHIIDCFANSCPYEIEVGKTYNIELTMNLSDSYQIKKISCADALIEKIGGYAYFLCGTLRSGVFESFTDLHDEDVHYDYPEFNDQLIKLEVDRIDVNFL
ncbi:hypothetical protein [Pseudomonas frederiksbergensis]|uniref:hypothetical protein n=1 Tax=Pseudomonas frederiksbergensis TaxID=104087 RepID=UPI003D2209E8